jgi:hypothetical protein
VGMLSPVPKPTSSTNPWTVSPTLRRRPPVNQSENLVDIARW